MQSAPSPRQTIGDRHPIIASAAVYAAYYAMLGFYTPYFPVWLAFRGLSETEIAWVMALPMFGRFVVAPLVGRWADDAEDRRKLLAVLCAITLAFGIVLSQMQGFWPILLASTAMFLVWQSVNPVIDATVVSLVRRGIARDYGRIRLWGSASFAVIAVFGGILLSRGGAESVYSAILVMLAAMIAAATLLPSAAPAEMRGRLKPLGLLGRRDLLTVYVAVALILASQAALNSFASVHWLRLGYPDWSIGILWTVGVIAEIVMFWLGPLVVSRLGAHGLLLVSASVTAARWLLMGFDLPIGLAALLQLAHAATLSCTFMGLMAFVQQLVEDEAGARAQGAFVTISGLTMAVMTLAIGPIYRALGGGAFAVSAVLPLAALALLIYRGPALKQARAPQAADRSAA